MAKWASFFSFLILSSLSHADAQATGQSNFRVICAAGSAGSADAQVFTIELQEPSSLSSAELEALLNNISAPRNRTNFRITHYRGIRFQTGQDILSIQDQMTPENVLAGINIQGHLGNRTISIRNFNNRDNGEPLSANQAYVEISYGVPFGDDPSAIDAAPVTYYNKQPGIFTSGVIRNGRNYVCSRAQMIDLRQPAEVGVVPPADGSSSTPAPGAPGSTTTPAAQD